MTISLCDEILCSYLSKGVALPVPQEEIIIRGLDKPRQFTDISQHNNYCSSLLHTYGRDRHIKNNSFSV